jgi:hypothetical protein
VAGSQGFVHWPSVPMRSSAHHSFSITLSSRIGRHLLVRCTLSSRP